ncbi:unnamed protein product [Darwinula stevensoni]|uniref:Hexosyltransferase n=1 Tax=Darwinula stevensoni TaxID=69355 RepID=A0A7R8X372_9CRUS|nr:unnamed protein product [Darwinula stevensoni]CAG0884079.1 unnamed protein product [Darwinula stevensoni]
MRGIGEGGKEIRGHRGTEASWLSGFLTYMDWLSSCLDVFLRSATHLESQELGIPRAYLALEEIARKGEVKRSEGMEAKDRERLERRWRHLRDRVIPGPVLPFLIEKGILSSEDFQDIHACPSDAKRMDRLLCILTKRGPNAFTALVDALKHDYEWEAQALEEAVPVEKQRDATPVEVTEDMEDLMKRNARLIRDWRKLARRLGLGSAVHGISVRVNLREESAEECLGYLLQEWRGTKGERATFPVLLAALRREHFNDVAGMTWKSKNAWNVLAGVLVGLGITFVCQKLLLFGPGTSSCRNGLLSPDARANAKEEKLVLIGVMTTEAFLRTRVVAAWNTWAQEVPSFASGEVVFFTSGRSDLSGLEGLPVVALPGVDDSYPPQKKSFVMLKYMHDRRLRDFEWFMRLDDDTYVRAEKLAAFLRSVNSSLPHFIGQTGQGNKEEFGRLGLDYDENFCMGGPGIIFSGKTLELVAPHVKDCLGNLLSTHEDVELGRCVLRFANVSCTWAYEVRSLPVPMGTILYHNSSGTEAFTGSLKQKEVHRAITLHPIKNHEYFYHVHKYIHALRIRELEKQLVLLVREMRSLNELDPHPDDAEPSSPFNKSSLGTLMKWRPEEEVEIPAWEFMTKKSLYSWKERNPKRRAEHRLVEGIQDVVREVMEEINASSRERGRLIDFKEILYGYQRVVPWHGLDLILDLLLTYKKYRGKKMTMAVRRHAYLQRPFLPLRLRVVGGKEERERVNVVVPVWGRAESVRRFLGAFVEACGDAPPCRLILVRYRSGEDGAIDDAVREARGRVRGPGEVEVVEGEGEFVRGKALELGASRCCSSRDDLLFFIDVDLTFTGETLENVRSNTLLGKRVYFPIVFSLYDPSLVPLSPPSDPKEDDGPYDRNRGYWRTYGFGVVGIHKGDLTAIGGYDLSIVGWGKEDVDLYEKAWRRKGLDVFRAPDPTLVHVWHPSHCPGDLEASQLRMCRGSAANSLASLPVLHSLLLKDDLLKP